MPALEPTGPRSAAPGYAEPGVNVAVQAERTGVTPSVMIAEIMGRRARLVAGPATYSDSDMFKGPTTGKPKAKRWDGRHLTSEAMAREPCVLKQAARHLKTPGLISLGGGLPHPSNFPIERLEVTVAAPDGRGDNVVVSMGKYDASPALAATAAAVATLTKPATVTLNGSNGRTGNGTVRHPMKKPTTEESLLIPEEYDLATALNYNQAQGSPQLLRWVTEHTELVHSPPYSDWACSLTIGATGALEQALRMLCSGERGDAMLTEEFSFSTALETALPLGVRIVGVPVDAEGLVPNELDRIMADWREDVQGRRPHVLYTVPSGQNPTGATQGLERRREVMECARRWDLVVIEDDPYYYLQMDEHRANDSSNTTGNGTNGSVSAPPRTPQAAETVDAFLENLLPSLLSLDRDGRVLRLDSFSKVLVPGARLGWVTGPNQLVERYIRHAEVASQGPSGISQAVLWAIIDREWGHEGLLRWLMRIRGEYGRRRDALLDACEKFLPRGVVTWVPPRAGMFLWLKVDHTQHPDAATRSIVDIEEQIFDSCIAKGVLVVRGSWFRAEREKDVSGLYFRATYAMATDADMVEAIKRFGAAVRESFGITE